MNNTIQENNNDFINLTLEFMTNKKHLKKLSDNRKISTDVEPIKETLIYSENILYITNNLINNSPENYTDVLKKSFDVYIHACLDHIYMLQKYDKKNDSNINDSDINDSDINDSDINDSDNGSKDLNLNSGEESENDFENESENEFKSDYENNNNSDGNCLQKKTSSSYISSNIKNCWGKSIKKSL